MQAEALGAWISPLILLPGAALLINSTAVRYGQLHGELHHMIDHHERESQGCRKLLLRRATLFRNALVSLYISVSFFALGGLLGGLTSAWDEMTSIWFVIVLTCLGIAMLVAGSVFLIFESMVSLDVIRDHISQIEEDPDIPQHPTKSTQRHMDHE